MLAWRRVVAASVLIWALMDLSVPGFCQSDDFDAAGSISVPVASPSLSSHELKLQNERQNQGPVNDEDDCFCCCAHVLPSQTTIVESSVIVVASAQPLATSYFSADLVPPTEPPKL